MSTVILLLIYVVVSAAAQAYHGTKFLAGNSSDVLNALGGKMFGSPPDKLMIITVLTSASASTQTTILPTARTTLSMARWRAIPAAFDTVHARFLTPSFSTLLMGGLSILWTVALLERPQLRPRRPAPGRRQSDDGLHRDQGVQLLQHGR